MNIQSLVVREQAHVVIKTRDGTDYVFARLVPGGPHVARVDNPEHAEQLLALRPPIFREISEADIQRASALDVAQAVAPSVATNPNPTDTSSPKTVDPLSIPVESMTEEQANAALDVLKIRYTARQKLETKKANIIEALQQRHEQDLIELGAAGDTEGQGTPEAGDEGKPAGNAGE